MPAALILIGLCFVLSINNFNRLVQTCFTFLMICGFNISFFKTINRFK